MSGEDERKRGLPVLPLKVAYQLAVLTTQEILALLGARMDDQDRPWCEDYAEVE